ncbi:transposase [Streptococcus thermophilus]|uniref:transposase n=1 Tax=Streptococcus thermophilus TaxID=1308 RepID=UPI003A7FCA69
MTQFTTELFNFLAQKQDIDEFFRTSLETAMNDLLQAELSAFLGYEPYDKLGYNFKQNQRIHKGFGQCADTLESLFD